MVPADRLVFEAGVKVPVRFDTALVQIRRNASRYNDSAPWNGDGQWRNETVGWNRTTGFGVHGNGHSYVLTAAHCASAGDYLTASGQYVGPIYSYVGPIYSYNED